MRRIIIFFALSLFIGVGVSCSKDGDLLDAVLADEATENSNNPNNNNGEGSDQANPPGDAGPPVDFEGTLAVNDTPCDFSLDTLEADATLELDCRIDLGGQTVNLPSGVTLKYTGGEIINGTLNFSGGQIDGELLNKDLELTGEVTLTSDIFQLYPERWSLVQGQVDDVTARNNRDVLEDLFFRIKELGGYRFEIDQLDAFFKVDDYLNLGTPASHAINVPSDFHLAMSQETYIRKQPNGHFRPYLLSVHRESNVIISGGNLIGDRETHNYNSGFVDSDGSTSTTHEWGTVLGIRGGQNVLIDNVTIREAAGDGINISSVYHHFDSRHIESQNITIRNSRIIACRRTNLVITDGHQIYIENNEIVDGGIDMANSQGIAPSSNLNIEPVREIDRQTGEAIYYEKVYEVYIRNNTQSVTNPQANPRAGDFQLSHGNGPIVIENNEMINSGVGFYTTDGVIIRNNTLTNAGIGAGAAENFGRTNVVFGNEIVGNTITSGGVGINVAGNGVSVRENIIEATTGIAFGLGAADSSDGLSNSEVLNNQITASNRGLLTMNTIQNVLVDGNNIHLLEESPFAITIDNNWNQNTESGFVISNNTITGSLEGTQSGAPASLIAGNSFRFVGNSLGDVQIGGGSDRLFENNVFDGRVGANSILFYADSPNTTFRSNTNVIYTSLTPLDVECVKLANGVSLSSSVVFDNNECIEN